jgi:hypothetical protein
MESCSPPPSSPEKQPLAELSPNTTSPTKASHQAAASKDLDFRAEILMDENTGHQHQQGKQTYISPSDQIMSPTTKKLSELKGRRFVSAKPQSLFTKTLGKQALRSEEKLSGNDGGGGAAADDVGK